MKKTANFLSPYFMFSIVVVIASLIYPNFIYANGEVQWQENGVPVVTDTYQDSYGRNFRMISDNQGGAILTWGDDRNGNSDIYAQRLNSEGNPLWIAGGLPVCTQGDTQNSPDLVLTTSGEVIIVWTDGRRGDRSGRELYAQKLDLNGNIIWELNGAPIYAQPFPGAGAPKIVPDNNGGAIISWSYSRGGWSPKKIYAQRVDSEGIIQWLSSGVLIADSTAYLHGQQMIPDGYGGAILTYSIGQRYGGVYARRVDEDGNVYWSQQPEGLQITTKGQGPKLILDSNKDIIIAWTDTRRYVIYGTEKGDVYAQKLDHDGNILWINDGAPVAVLGGSQSGPDLALDEDGGTYIAWSDGRRVYPEGGIYAQRLDSNGNAMWQTDGIKIAGGNSSRIISDGLGGAIITFRIGNDLYAQRFDLDGNLLWVPNGVPICTAPYTQWAQEMIPSVLGGVIIAWEDSRSGSRAFYDEGYLSIQ